MKKLALMLALACFAFALSAQEAPTPAPGRGPGMGRPQRQGGQAQMVERIKKDAEALLAFYDADGDGKINAAEAKKFMEDYAAYKKLQKFSRSLAIIEQLDANHDMVIDEEEAKNIKEIIGKMRPPQGGPRGERPNGPRGERPNGPRPTPKAPAETPAE